MVAGAYRRGSDNALILPVSHWETGELLGHQERIPGRRPLYTDGCPIRDAAPLIHSPIKPGENRLLVCEGPTDMLAVAEAGILTGWTLAACWSATSLPPLLFWSKFKSWSVYVAGDGDKAGADFNQRIADVFGVAYRVRIPEGHDVRKLVEQGDRGRLSFLSLVDSASFRPIHRKVKVWSKPKNRQPVSADIIQLVEAAGGKHRYKLSNGQHKYLCPLHDDRRDPSLTVDPKTGSWHCWSGCGAGGPAQFIMRSRGLSYERALEYLRVVA